MIELIYGALFGMTSSTFLQYFITTFLSHPYLCQTSWHFLLLTLYPSDVVHMNNQMLYTDDWRIEKINNFLWISELLLWTTIAQIRTYDHYYIFKCEQVPNWRMSTVASFDLLKCLKTELLFKPCIKQKKWQLFEKKS